MIARAQRESTRLEAGATGPRRRRDRLLSIALVLCVAFSTGASKQGRTETSSAYSDPAPSFDTTPVTVTVVDTTYEIPRNYLTPAQIPTLKLTWPGLEPQTPQTADCFARSMFNRSGCAPLEFRIFGSRGPAPGNRAFTTAERFQNFMRNIGVQLTAKNGPFGYDVYEVGPENARSELYWREEGDIYFHCSVSFDAHGGRGGFCDDWFQIEGGNYMQFFFPLSHIEHVAVIQERMRLLMKKFVSSGGGRR